MTLIWIFVISLLSITTFALDNGLARTPPMGWLSRARFDCNIDCENDPNNCLSEQLIKNMADRMIADGYKDAGYEYVNIDDCWSEKERDKDGKLVADRKRFPSGIKKLAEYVHAKGLKLGIYQDLGTETNHGYPGSYGHFAEDAATFAEWEIDWLEVDAYKAIPDQIDYTYPQFSDAINKTGRPIVFHSDWPFWQMIIGDQIDFYETTKYCNIFRTYYDIDDSWERMLYILDYFANQGGYSVFAGPGEFYDPDTLMIGNFGLSYDQEMAQFMLWTIMASPLMMSNDLRDVRKESAALLKNKEIIAVSQDSLGHMGWQVVKNDAIEIWIRPINPVINNDKYSFAVVFFSRKTLGGPTKVSTKLSDINLNYEYCYMTYDIFNVTAKTKLCPIDTLTVRVNPSGATMIIAQVISLA